MEQIVEIDLDNLNFENVINVKNEQYDYLKRLTELENNIKKQRELIQSQYDFIAMMRKELDSYRFYPSHPKDQYKINFGNKNWRGWTYRYVISNRDGERIINWLTTNKNSIPEVEEFRRYLLDINFNYALL